MRTERLQKILLTKMINSNALKNIELLKALTKVDFCRAVDQDIMLGIYVFRPHEEEGRKSKENEP